MPTLTDLICARLTPMQLGEPGPPPDVIARALAAAEAAPDHGRLRSWRFKIITGAGRSAFGDLLAEALQKRDPAATAEAQDKERGKPLRAPLIIVIAAVIAPGKIPEIEQVLAAGAAAQNLQLAFHDLGFGVQWKSGAACFDAQVKAGLGFTAADHLIGFMYVGSIIEPGRPRTRDGGSRASSWP